MRDHIRFLRQGSVVKLSQVSPTDMLLGYFDPKGKRKEAAHKRFLEKKRLLLTSEM